MIDPGAHTLHVPAWKRAILPGSGGHIGRELVTRCNRRGPA
jgi:hypothetical protein